MKPFPFIENGKLRRGTLTTVPEYCVANILRGKCRAYYERLVNKGIDGVYQCPRGLSTVVRKGNVVATAIKIKGFYNKSRARNISGDAAFENGAVKKIIEEMERFETERNSNSELHEYLNEVYHDIRKLNSAIMNRSTELIGICKSKQDIDVDNALYKIQNIHASSNMIRVQLDTFQMNVNPEITTKNKDEIAVYKRFEKAYHCLSAIKKKSKVSIKMIGESRRFFVGFQIFELVPFILIDNAIKYSPEDQEITLTFQETHDEITVIIESIGPKVEDDELPCLFDNNYRGKYTKNFEGSGKGLFLAKQICDLNNINITLNWQNKGILLNGIQYGLFTTRLVVPIRN